jgi:hypothetical protein
MKKKTKKTQKFSLFYSFFLYFQLFLKFSGYGFNIGVKKLKCGTNLHFNKKIAFSMHNSKTLITMSIESKKKTLCIDGRNVFENNSNKNVF